MALNTAQLGERYQLSAYQRQGPSVKNLADFREVFEPETRRRYIFKDYKTRETFLQCLNEVDVFSKIRSPFLVGGRGRGVIFPTEGSTGGGIMMELMDGNISNLGVRFKAFRQGIEYNFRLNLILKMMTHMVAAIRALQDFNYLHLDINPTNILYKVSENDPNAITNFKLADFTSSQGVGKLFIGEKLATFNLNKPIEDNIASSRLAYMAPEMINLAQIQRSQSYTTETRRTGKVQYDVSGRVLQPTQSINRPVFSYGSQSVFEISATTDLWSLGAVMLEVMTGQWLTTFERLRDPIKTAEECIKVFENLKQTEEYNLPQSVKDRSSYILHWIRAWLNPDPNKRLNVYDFFSNDNPMQLELATYNSVSSRIEEVVYKPNINIRMYYNDLINIFTSLINYYNPKIDQVAILISAIQLAWRLQHFDPKTSLVIGFERAKLFEYCINLSKWILTSGIEQGVKESEYQNVELYLSMIKYLKHSFYDATIYYQSGCLEQIGQVLDSINDLPKFTGYLNYTEMLDPCVMTFDVPFNLSNRDVNGVNALQYLLSTVQELNFLTYMKIMLYLNQKIEYDKDRTDKENWPIYTIVSTDDAVKVAFRAVNEEAVYQYLLYFYRDSLEERLLDFLTSPAGARFTNPVQSVEALREFIPVYFTVSKPYKYVE